MMSKELEELVKRALKHKMTPQEVWDQRISFAFGNQKLSGDEIPREEFIRAATEMYGPRPME